jgi:hypothetical protein
MHSGWLNKEGGLLISKWQRRWFELDAQAGKLKYYIDNQGTATARGEILVRTSQHREVDGEREMSRKSDEEKLRIPPPSLSATAVISAYIAT